MPILCKALIILCVLTICPVASAKTEKFEGVKAIAAGSINPPSPAEGCNSAKRKAEAKAVNEGAIVLVSWDRLTKDSDCSLTTPGARGVGYFYIFTARGNFRMDVLPAR